MGLAKPSTSFVVCPDSGLQIRWLCGFVDGADTSLLVVEYPELFTVMSDSLDFTFKGQVSVVRQRTTDIGLDEQGGKPVKAPHLIAFNGQPAASPQAAIFRACITFRVVFPCGWHPCIAHENLAFAFGHASHLVGFLQRTEFGDVSGFGIHAEQTLGFALGDGYGTIDPANATEVLLLQRAFDQNTAVVRRKREEFLRLWTEHPQPFSV